MEGDLEVRPGVTIAAHELIWTYTTSGGPGGQHANRSKTKAVLRFEIKDSASLAAAHKTRLRETVGDSITVEVGDSRSQWQNKRVARERLAERLRAGLHRPRARRATKPSRGAKQRRLTAKRQRGEIKRNRRKPPMD